MPFTFAYLDESQGIRISGSEIVTAAEILAVTRQILADVRGGKTIEYALIDLGGITDFKLNEQDFSAIAAKDEEIAGYLPRLFIAVVASSALAFGIGRTWEAYVALTGWVIEVFRDTATAEQWLESRVGVLRSA